MTITCGSALPKDDIERMMRDAEAHAEEDKRRREEAEVKNQAGTLVYQTEKLLRDNPETVPAAEKESVEQAIANLKKALEGGDIEAIKSGTEQLAAEAQKMGSAMYANAQASQGSATGESYADAGAGGASGATNAGEDEVVDAEIVDDEGTK